MNTDELDEAFRREKADTQTRLAEHLAAGGEIDLLDAISFCSITNLRELWPLAQFDACGRIGGPLEPMQPIAKTAWPALRMVMVKCDAFLETPEGERIYDVRLSMSKDRSALEFRKPQASALDELPAPASSSSRAEHTAHAQRLVDLDEFFSAMVADIRTWRESDYGPHLQTAKLSLTPDGKRLKLSLANGAVHRNVIGKTALATILVVFSYRMQAASLCGPIDKRSRAKMALIWLISHHPDLVADDVRYRERLDDMLDETIAKVRKAGFLD